MSLEIVMIGADAVLLSTQQVDRDESTDKEQRDISTKP